MKRLFILLIFYSSLNAQKVKISATAGGNYSAGNTGLLLGSLQGNIHTDSSNKEWSISPYFCYSQVSSNGVQKPEQRESYITGAYTLRKSDWSLYLFFDAENSLQKRFNFNGSIGVGAGTKLINSNDIYLGGSIAIMPEYYTAHNNMYEKTLRLSARLKFVTKGKIKVSSITLIQPPIIMYPK